MKAKASNKYYELVVSDYNSEYYSIKELHDKCSLKIYYDENMYIYDTSFINEMNFIRSKYLNFRLDEIIMSYLTNEINILLQKYRMDSSLFLENEYRNPDLQHVYLKGVPEGVFNEL